MTGRESAAAVGIVWALGLALSCSSDGQTNMPGNVGAAGAEAGSPEVAGSGGASGAGHTPLGGEPGAGQGGGARTPPAGGAGGDVQGGKGFGGDDVVGGFGGAPSEGGASGVPNDGEAGSGGEGGNPCSSSADLVWAVPVAKLGLGVNVYARSIAALSDSSSVVVGELSGGGGVRFGAGTLQEVVTNAHGAFWARFDAQGALVSARRYTGAYANAVAAAPLPDSSFVVAGYFRDRLTFDGGLATERILQTDDPQDEDPFLARVDGSGNVVWALRGAGPASTLVTSVAVLPNGNIALVGRGSVGFEHGGSAVAAGFGTGLTDGYIAVFSPSGTPLWARAVRVNAVNQLTALADGSIALTGWFFESATFASTSSSADVNLSDGNRYWESLFVARYLGDGQLSWVKRTTNRAVGFGVLSSGSDRILVTGYASGAVFDADRPTPVTVADAIFIAEYDTLGELHEVRATKHRYIMENDLLMTSKGALVSTGEGSTFGGVEAPAGGGAFVLCQSATGDLGWVGITGGQGMTGRSIAALPNGDVVATGRYSYSDATAAVGTSQATQLPVDQGSLNSYVLRYRP